MSTVISGSCLCGGVRFEVDPPFILRRPLPLLPLSEALGLVWSDADACSP